MYEMGFHNRLCKKCVCSQLGVTFVSDRNKNVTRSRVSVTQLDPTYTSRFFSFKSGNIVRGRLARS